jgi:hypothetical protein
MMNETVYLFALSLPALLARIVADSVGDGPTVVLPASKGRS